EAEGDRRPGGLHHQRADPFGVVGHGLPGAVEDVRGVVAHQVAEPVVVLAPVPAVEFLQLDRRHGREYYHRLRYLMGDYSPHVLDRARQAVAHHAERVSALVVEATRPSVTLGFLAGKAFLVYISNVYDNLPTDELACIHGRTYQVETQAFLTEDDAGQIAERFGTSRDELAKLIDRLLR